MTRERGVLDVSAVQIVSLSCKAATGALAANACRPLNHKTFKIHNSLTQNHRRESRNDGSKVTLYYFTALFSPQYCEVLTETVKNRFCSINSPITAVLCLLSAMSAVNGGSAAKGEDSSTVQVLPRARQHGKPSLHSTGVLKSPSVRTCTSVCTERQHEPKREKSPEFTSVVNYIVHN